jgi:type IV pilus assembly protein PilY1
MPRSLRGITCILALTLLNAATVFADDTEVYIGNATLASDVQPNLVFIIDTSGSMDNDVEMEPTGAGYDPAITYPSEGCDLDKVYWREGSNSSTVPSCNTDQYFMATSNTCKASYNALSASGSGFYITDRAARYRVRNNRSNIWRKLRDNNHTHLVECKDDSGVHGENDASTNLYAAHQHNNGPWRATSGSEINWNDNDVARSYTFYSGNYLNYRHGTGGGGTITKTRLEIVQEVFSNLMDSISSINLAVMRFDKDAGSNDGTDGGYFIMPMQPLNDSNRAAYKTAVNNTIASGATPLSETLYESYLFYQGAAVDYGDSSEPAVNVSTVLNSEDTSKYKSPIEYQCQKNFTILLTDGLPTYDGGADSKIEALPGFATTTGAASCSGNCMDELAEYAYKQDCSNLDGEQNVITYTIGFATDQVLLSNTATKGGGSYYTADNTAELEDAFTNIIAEIAATNTTFIAPAVSVNAFNRFNHRDELYYALFRPSASPNWQGNVKRFRLAGDPPIIVDANGTSAIDPNTGFFRTTATSFWTPVADSPDGDDVGKGGAASKLTLPRTMYTYTGATAPNNASLSNTTNALHENNTAITKTMLGNAGMSDAYRTSLLQWSRGVDIFDDNADTDFTDIRRRMGDPLHAEPVLVTYGGTDADPDITLYAGTNDGQLNAINTTNGTEVFTFIPQELICNLPILYEDAGGTDHPYGLDGPLTTWINDVNGNGILYNTSSSLDSGEHVYLYQGMRRGGKSYYALDVTSRTSPTLKWVITGASGDFSELGQTWSAATHGKIKINGVDKDVLFFGGGYDEDQDNNVVAQNDDEGRAIYIVDASTGAKLWQAGPAGTGNAATADPTLVMSGMTNSIPAELSVLDMDGDGYKDRIYAADMRGQIWRFDLDIDNNTSASNLATGGIIAQLGDTTAAHNRRFYYAPDVSLSKDRKHLNIAIGSGYRAHPLNTTIHDAFYVIKDTNVYAPPVNGSGVTTYSAITMSDLFDATSNIIKEGTAEEITNASSSLSSANGFYIWMNNESDNSFEGEKVLAKSLTFSEVVLFTTYKPIANQASLCSASVGSGSAFAINISDGTPVDDYDLSGGNLTRSDRRINLVKSGIPPAASIIFHENGPVVLIGTEKGPDPDLLLEPQKTYWHEQ